MVSPKEQSEQILNDVRMLTSGIAAYNYDEVNIDISKYIIDKILHNASDSEYWVNVKNEIESI